ncbi:iron complex outermembrane recepter protein [Pseudarcicella hirudinis]|uniref:Iron complex outermembrane recepter protein n=2 Tax=Pseudarcicella hirudinis TaxID=1079859 RepID=A0A1I5TYL8_9BACT|nr:SusC/RagA family TonB-linked outer membrane protein [Pseudarcicella hirudinis]SFP88099.1 iron complex outermembrane recepter protein [Pseudarcicella hirudinis]
MKSKFTLFITVLLFLSWQQIYAQQNVIKGKVTDDSQSPLPGVNILLKGTMKGTTSDANGNYAISVPVKGAVLVFRSLGFTTKEVNVNGRSVIDLALEASTQNLDEVVVTALGIKKDAKALGYAVSKIDADRILASGTPVNALQSLYGTAPGVQVAATAAGQTGGMKINIRNAVSFDKSSSTRPLLVVDGIPIHDQNTQMGADATARDNGTGINDINPDDIASFEILRGAKASVLYGSEGANGVILITTKSGAKGKGLGVSASFTTTWDRAAFQPDLQNEYGSGSSPSNPKNDAQGFFINGNGKRALPSVAGDGGTGAFGPKFDPNVKVLWWDGVERPWVAQTKNIYDDLYTTGHQNTTNVALSGGNEQGQIRFSYTNLSLTPITPGASYSKNTFSLNASHKLNNYINLKYTGNFYFSNNLNAPNLNTMNGQAQQASLGAYSADLNVGLLRDKMVTPDGYNYFANPSRRNILSGGALGVVGLFWDQLQNKSEFSRLHNIQSLTADITLSKTFGASLVGGIDYSTDRNEYKGRLLDPNLLGPLSGFRYSDITNIYKTAYGQALLNFNTKLSSDINLSGFVGGIIRQNTLETKGANVNGYGGGGLVIPNYFSFNNLPLGVQPLYQFANGEDMLYSTLGSVQLVWKDQVFVEAQARNDRSSILPPNQNSYFYPGVSATWIFSQGLKLPDYVKFAKLRASWADVGRPGPRYFSNVNYSTSQSGGGYILTPPTDLPPIDANGSPNLKPEHKREFELGFETYLFENRRIGVDFSYYNSNIYDQIMAVAAPPGTGANNIRMNAGSVQTIGWELGIKTVPILKGDFRWDLNLTFASGKTYVNQLDGKLQSLALWNAFGSINAVANVGQEYGQLYLTKSNYTYKDPNNENNPSNGQKVVNAAGTAYDYTSTAKLVGKLIPDVTGGLSTSFTYKRFRLFANINYQFGGTILSGTETYMMAAGVLKESLKYRDEAHGGIAYYLDANSNKVAGNNPGSGPTFHDGVLLSGVDVNGNKNTKVVSAQDYYYNSYFSNGFFPEDRIFKSDYIALRNISLDYTLNTKLLQRMHLNLSRLTLSVFANNVLYLYKVAPNTIPESTNGTGWDTGGFGTTALPAQRSMGVSIKVNF